MESFDAFFDYFFKTVDPNNVTCAYKLNRDSYHEPYWFEDWTPVDAKIFIYQSNKIVFTLGILYMIFVYLGPKLMKNRKPMELRKPLALWNFFLSAVSTLIVYRGFIDYVDLWIKKGHYEALCLPCVLFLSI